MVDQDLYQLLILDFPIAKDAPKGFLEICGQAHRETVNSSVYAHFLSRDNNPFIAELFKSSLMNLIRDKQGIEVPLEEYEVHTEYSTFEGRIDILLKDGNNQSAIIIENKIYHHLNNNLEDYWTSVTESNKSGIVLTLYPQEIEPKYRDRYINITHLEWINEIRNTGLPSGLSSREYLYLNDFFNSMDHLTHMNEMDEQITFFFEHQHKLIKAQELYLNGKYFVKNQIKPGINSETWQTYGNNDSWIHLWFKDQKEDLYYVLGFDHIYHPQPGKKPTLGIYIQIEKAALEHESEMYKFTTGQGKYPSLMFNGAGHDGRWKHFAWKEYELNKEDLGRWVEFALEKIEVDFQELYDEMRGYLRGKNN